MLEKGRITPYQLFCMIFSFTVGSSILIQSLTAAGRDTWISSILAILAGVSMVLVTTSLAVKFPNLTLVQYAQVLFGKIIGKIIGVLYLWYFLHLGALVLRNFGEFLSGEVMTETPIWFFHVTLALVVVILTYSGIEVAGRLSELVFPIIILIIIVPETLISLSGIMEINNILPLGENGIAKIIKGAVPIASFPYQEAILFTMFFPFVNNVQRCKKAAVSALLAAGAILFFTLTQTITVFGENTATLTFPRYSAIRLISVGEFIERVDAAVLVIWIMGGLVKIGVCLYAFVLGLAQILGLKDYRSLILPAAALMVVLSVLIYENTFEMLDFAVNIYPVYAFPFQVALPLLMLLLASAKKKGKRRKLY